MALAPNFPTDPYVYVLYTYDARDRRPPPRWGRPASTPTPARPRPADRRRLRRQRAAVALQAAGNVMTGTEQVLIEDWCQQYPSHSIGAVEFGADGALYVSGGDGASFNFVDYGQDGTRSTPAATRPGASAPPWRRRPPRAARCAARTCAPPATRSGSTAPSSASTRPPARPARQPAGRRSDPNARRIIAYGLRNPFRFTVRPGTERGLGRRRRLERLGGDQPHRRPDRRDGRELRLALLRGRRPPVRLRRRQPQHLREPVRAAGAVTDPYFAYHHSNRSSPARPARPAARRSRGWRSSSPARQHLPGRVRRRALLRRLLARLHLGDAQGRRRQPGDPGRSAPSSPAPPTRSTCRSAPDGDLFYVDFDGGTIRRISYTAANQPPTAVATATPTTGHAPADRHLRRLRLQRPRRRRPDLRLGPRRRRRLRRLDRRHGRPTPTPPGTYTARCGSPTPGRVRHRLGDDHGRQHRRPPRPSTPRPPAPPGRSATSSTSPARPPTPRTAPCPPSADWELILQHCPSNCHTHPIRPSPASAGARSRRPTTSTRRTWSCGSPRPTRAG